MLTKCHFCDGREPLFNSFLTKKVKEKMCFHGAAAVHKRDTHRAQPEDNSHPFQNVEWL
jgi:hypothetical protein